MSISTGQIDVKRAVSENRRVRFSHYKDGCLWYATEFDETFPVPVADLGSATAHAEDKALMFMRYMRKWNQETENTDG